MTDLSEESVAKMLFNAYNEQGPNPWKTFDGRDVPRWDQLGPQVSAKWVAVARSAIRYLRPSPPKAGG